MNEEKLVLSLSWNVKASSKSMLLLFVIDMLRKSEVKLL